MSLGLGTDRLALAALATQLQGRAIGTPGWAVCGSACCGAGPRSWPWCMCVVRVCAYAQMWFGLKGGRGLLFFWRWLIEAPRAWAFLYSPLVPYPKYQPLVLGEGDFVN